jgi:hypothetical protein
LNIETPPFSREEMRARVPEFLELHAKRPIKENRGGMRAPHLFATWFMVQKLAPTHIVESGVFKGLGTWLLEQAAPAARLYCIDPDPSARVYQSSRASYLTEDFAKLSWDLPRETTLLFFDDHQDELRRVEESRKLGFRHVIFEDNYPPGQGDCFSLKQALMGERRPDGRGGLAGLVNKLLPRGSDGEAKAELEAALDCYYEFPPVLRVERPNPCFERPIRCRATRRACSRSKRRFTHGSATRRCVRLEELQAPFGSATARSCRLRTQAE